LGRRGKGGEEGKGREGKGMRGENGRKGGDVRFFVALTWQP